MNEAYSLFSKVDSLVEDPYVEPSFFGSINVKSIIPVSHGIRMNDMNNVMWYMNYYMCYVKYTMCCLKNDKFDDACCTHGMTLQIQICQVY